MSAFNPIKITFEDGSFLEIIESGDNIRLVLCGHKDKNQLTMSAADLTKEQAKNIIDFIKNILDSSSNKG